MHPTRNSVALKLNLAGGRVMPGVSWLLDWGGEEMKRLWSILVVCLLVLACADISAAPYRIRKIDEFGDICCDDEKARLDNFAIELQNNPEALGYIIFYGGRTRNYPYCHSSRLRLPRRGDAEARAARLKPYIVMTRGVPPERLVVVNGGYREHWQAELWIVPKGEKPPAPSPTLQPGEIKFRKGRRAKRSDYYCEV